MSSRFVIILLVSAALLGGDEGPGQTQEPAGKKPTPLLLGAPVCVDCHRDGKEGVLCLCTEVRIWEKGDKHRNAYEVLGGDRAKRMGELLGYPPTDARCVSCHGVVTAGKKTDPSFRIEEGVTCVICHGPYQEWAEFHGLPTRREAWRQMSRETKEREHGMTDLWDPMRRAELCLSCHVGNAGQGKVVTHDMYAAGHPPLPSMEPATFSNQMPRHWQYLREKPPAVQKLLQFADPRDLEETQLALLGGLAALREEMRLLAAEAERKARDHEILDLARFDCYACHHDLKSPSWRQRIERQGGAPGRPLPRSWPMALVPAAITLAAQGNESEAARLRAEFEGLRNRLLDAYRRRPFGDNAAIAASATALAQWADALARRARKAPCHAEQARHILRELIQLPDAGSLDYDSARQVAWAIRTIAAELGEAERFKPVLNQMTQELKLDLPAGQKREIIGELPQFLQALNEYDPATFARRLGELRNLIPKSRGG